MTILRKAVCAALLFVAPGVAHASAGSGGYVSNVVYSINGGQIYFEQSGPRTTPPTCAGSGSKTWVVDPTTSSGQAAVAVLLTAYAQHKQIYVGGTGNCATVSPDTEIGRGGAVARPL